jgi:hypothetical protein
MCILIYNISTKFIGLVVEHVWCEPNSIDEKTERVFKNVTVVQQKCSYKYIHINNIFYI